MITNITSTPITITLPTGAAVYINDNTLPNLTPIEKEDFQEDCQVKYVDISDDELTFMDDKCDGTRCTILT